MAIESGLSVSYVKREENILRPTEEMFNPKPQNFSKPENKETITSTLNLDKIMSAYETINNREQNQTFSTPKPKPAKIEQKSFISKEKTAQEKIIGQYKDTYILIEKEDGLEIVDQHIADERFIYETLSSQKEPASQILFISDIIELMPEEMEQIKYNLEKFEKFGYGIELLSDKELMFRKIPQMLTKYSPKEIIRDILENGDVNNLEEKILITTSCKAAVKANTPLNHFQMEEIIRNWRGCKMPYTCPHGRPISKLLKHNEIASFFMRPE